MSQRYSELRYLQIRILLGAALAGLIASGVLWLSGVVKGAADPWVKWPFRAAALSFFFTVYDLAIPALELRMMIKQHRYPPLTRDQRVAGDREFYTGALGFVIGLAALLLVLYRLSAASPS